MVKSLDDEASLSASSLFIAAIALGMLWALISGWKTPEVVVRTRRKRFLVPGSMEPADFMVTRLSNSL